MDLSCKQSDQVSETEDMSSQTTPTPERISSSDGTYLKTCADCGTTKTPLWRSGPAGPKSLCNACGIRSRKKRRALIGPKEEKKIKKSSSSNIIRKHNSHSSDTSTCSSSSGCGGENNNNNNDNNNNNNSNSISKLGEKASFKSKLLGFGCNNNITPMQRPRSNITSQRRRKISEVEQAAFVLMALSCGSVYA